MFAKSCWFWLFACLTAVNAQGVADASLIQPRDQICEDDFASAPDPLSESLSSTVTSWFRDTTLVLHVPDENRQTARSRPLFSLQTKKRIRGIPVSVAFRVSVSPCGQIQTAPPVRWIAPTTTVPIGIFRPPRVS
jgi:hypothetical protein